MFTAHVNETSLEEGSRNESKTPPGAKHTLSSTISPPDTPADIETSPTAFSQPTKIPKMDSTENSVDYEVSMSSGDANGSLEPRISVIASGAQNINISAKYDRQIRIWGDHGQASLSSGCVYIIGHSMSASEIAKNLSLAGVGSLVFVDSGDLVSPADSVKQAVPPLHSFVGKPFSDAMAHWAKLFNPSATISCLRLKSLHQLADFIHSGDQHVKRPSCVIICNPSYVAGFEQIIDQIIPVPVITCTTIGLLAYARICLPPVYPIVETHLEYVVDDLRLLEPFPALISIFKLLNFDQLSGPDRRSVPWPLIVLHFLQKMFPDNKKSLSPSQRDSIKQHLREIARKDRIENNEEAENLEQAVKGVNAALTAPTGIPHQLQHILQDSKINDSQEPFWLMCAALKQFIAKRSHLKYPLPLRGAIPDISASTVRFVSLQEAYRQQADTDAAEVHKFAIEIAQQRNVLPEKIPNFLDVQLFCKNAAFIKVCRGVSLSQEDLSCAKDWQAFETYSAMRAIDSFSSKNNRLPSSDEDITEIVKKESSEIDSTTLNELVCAIQSPEVCASIIGGILSHEAVKLITGQFVPVDNVFVYDGRTKAISAHFISCNQ